MPFGTTDRGYASIVHQNINRPQGFLDLLQRRVNLRFVSEVSLDSMSTYAERFKLFGDCLQAFEPACHHGDIRSCHSQALRKLNAQSTRRPSHERYFPA
jgi:hypothetical protein